MMRGFWARLKKPIIGLAPMDGVTDAAFRYITAKYGRPDVMYTEFTAAEGISAGALRLMRDFRYSEIERPAVAQVFGSHPEAFYQTAVAVASLGFDGMDINMGCPAKNIAEQGSGAALILKPDLAKEIIRASQRGLEDWANGVDIASVGLPDTIVQYARSTPEYTHAASTRALLPLTVKTRIGYNAIVIDEWIPHLLEMRPVAIAIHGRTLKQLYSGEANWDAIGRAAEIARGSGAMIFGNGDVKDADEARGKAERYGLEGILIGRASQGNPWIFARQEAGVSERLAVALEHARLFESILPDQHFLHMRKHLAWYCTSFEGAKDLRAKLMASQTADDVERIIKAYAGG